jgi:hypothetical protein
MPKKKGPLFEGNQLFDQKNFTEARIKYQQAAESGSAEAKTNLGIIAVIFDEYNDAFRLFYEAMLQGDVDALHNLGACFEHGLGVPEYIPAAIHYYARASIAGNAQAAKTYENYIKVQGQALANRLLASESVQIIDVIESTIIQSVLPDQVMTTYQLLKHPVNRKVVTGILREAQKCIVQATSPKALEIISQLFRYEFVIHDYKYNSDRNLEITWGKVYDLIKEFKKYQNYIEKKASDHPAKVKLFDSIFKTLKIAFLTNAQRELVYKDFLEEIDNQDWGLSSACKRFAKEFAAMIKEAKLPISILEILDTNKDFDDRLARAVIPKLPHNANVKTIEIFNHPENCEIVKNIIDETVDTLMKSLTIVNAVKLIALLEFKEKIFGLEIAPLFFMKILHDLKLVCPSNLTWILERLENISCQDVRGSNGFYTIMDRVVAIIDPSIIDKILKDLSHAISNMVSTIHATSPNTILWKQAQHILADYRMTLIAYMYQRKNELDPIVEMMSKENDLSAKKNWADIFSKLPRPPEGVDRLTFTSDAIWFATTLKASRLIVLKEAHHNLQKNINYLQDFIETYDTYLIQLEKGTNTSKKITPASSATPQRPTNNIPANINSLLI